MQTIGLLCIGALFAMLGSSEAPVNQRERPIGDTAAVRVVEQHTLPRLDGAKLEGTMVEVRLAPGEVSPAHRHPCPVFAYIVRGAIHSRLGEGRDSVYTAGQSFYEAPLTLHRSSNASATEPAVLLAMFVCDKHGPLTIPPAGAGSRTGR